MESGLPWASCMAVFIVHVSWLRGWLWMCLLRREGGVLALPTAQLVAPVPATVVSRFWCLAETEVVESCSTVSPLYCRCSVFAMLYIWNTPSKGDDIKGTGADTCPDTALTDITVQWCSTCAPLSAGGPCNRWIKQWLENNKNLLCLPTQTSEQTNCRKRNANKWASGV